MESATAPRTAESGERTLVSLTELTELVPSVDHLYLRYSKGFDADQDSTSLDGESGLTLPGLSVNPLTPEPWWTRPLEDWLARQICQYEHLAEDEDRYAWVLTGACVGRGPDCEPLLVDVRPLGRLVPEVLQEAKQIYEDRFDAGERPSQD